MTAVSYTAAQIGIVDPQKSRVKSYIAGATITKGQPVYIVPSTGKVDLADANGSGTKQFRGIALNGGGAGQAIDVLEDGEVYGFSLSGNYDSLVYVADSVGTYADAAGTVTVPVGRVVPLSDGSLTKVLRVFVKRDADWA